MLAHADMLFGMWYAVRDGTRKRRGLRGHVEDWLRALRPAVIKRKRSFGCHSEEGCRFVERLLSVTQTLRMQGRPVLEYLVEVLAAHRHGPPLRCSPRTEPLRRKALGGHLELYRWSHCHHRHTPGEGQDKLG